MTTRNAHEERKRRDERRLARLRGRVVIASSLTFAALFALAGQHSLSGSKHAARTLVRRTAGTSSPVRFFDQQPDGFAFDDSSAAASRPAPAAPATTPAALPSPPVAQTNVS